MQTQTPNQQNLSTPGEMISTISSSLSVLSSTPAEVDCVFYTFRVEKVITGCIAVSTGQHLLDGPIYVFPLRVLKKN